MKINIGKWIINIQILLNNEDNKNLKLISLNSGPQFYILLDKYKSFLLKI